MTKQKIQTANNAFGLGDIKLIMGCKQCQQTARKVGKSKDVETEALYKFTAEVGHEDLIGTPFFEDVFQIINPDSGKQLTLEGKEIPAGGSVRARPYSSVSYENKAEKNYNFMAHYDMEHMWAETLVECRQGIKLQKISTDENKDTTAPKAILHFQCKGAALETMGYRGWMGHKHEISFEAKVEQQVNKENAASRKATAAKGQGDVEEVAGDPSQNGAGD